MLLTLSTAQAEKQRVRAPAGLVEQGAVSQLPALTVTARPVSGYSASDASTATKADTPIMDTPVSIQVVPQQVLEDQQAIRLQDALKNVSGVTNNSIFGGYRPSFNIRGFPTERRQYRDGF